MAVTALKAKATTTTTPRHRVTVGMKFNAVYKDGSFLWVVVKRRGSGTWDCKIVEDDCDYGGTKKVFSSEDILHSRRVSNAFAAHRSEGDAFWDAVKIGSVLHYHSGFGEYVRATVGTLDGEKFLLPIGLVGIPGSFKHDLPRRRRFDGTVVAFYHADRITNAIPFRPCYTNIFESPAFNNRYPGYDPCNDTLRDLSIPPLEGHAAIAIAAMWEVRKNVCAALSAETGGTDIHAALTQAAAILKTAGY